MTVAELISLLQTQDPDVVVGVTTSCHGCYGDDLSIELDGDFVWINGDR